MIIFANEVKNKFCCYTFLANKLALMELDKSLSGAKTFLIGALANAIATLITYPIQVVQAKMRVSYYFSWKMSSFRSFFDP